MPRSVRIEYEGAFHHVMNRGRNRQAIFHDASYFEEFLTTLQEASERFKAVIHAYCLMTNHYHLLIETPQANLSRIMQHINGLYTQRHNRKRKQDGTLFRGRYKSVLVDEDNYLLQLSRYIHRNPLEVKTKMVDELANYPWSSYPAYVNKVTAPDWLSRDKTYQMLGKKQRYKGYQSFVENSIEDEDIKRFYSKGNILSVLGDKEFKTQRQDEFEVTDLAKLRQLLQDKPPIVDMLNILARIQRVNVKQITERHAGKRRDQPLRAFAMYVCHHYCKATRREIADSFGLTHVGSVSSPITRIRKEIDQGKWKDEILNIQKILFIV